jgi:putative spermidine/putrescine transport system permease protein
MAPILCILPLVVFLAAVLVLPFANMAVQGLMPSTELIGSSATAEQIKFGIDFSAFTLRNYAKVFTDPWTRSTLTLSLTVSVVVSVLSILLCIGPAWLLVRKEFPGKRLLRAILTLPMSFSGVIIGFLAVIMIGRIGFIPQVTKWAIGVPLGEALAYGMIGLGLAYIWFQIPRATLTLEAAIRKFDWDLESAARSLGATPFQALRYVLLPLLTPAIVSTAAITFAVSMGSYGVALLLLKRETVMPVEIQMQMYANMAFELAAAMSVILSLITVGVNYTLRKYGERHYAFQNR